MTQADKQVLCRCGHKRAAHFGKEHAEDCGASTEGFHFCSCKRFVEHQFKNEEEIEMAKKTSGKKVKGERRVSHVLYFIDAKKAEAFKDGKLFEAKNDTYSGVLARTLASNADGLTFDKLIEKTKEKIDHKNETTFVRNVRWYLSHSRSELSKFISSEREKVEAKSEAKSEAKPKKERKPRAKKVRPSVAAMEATTEEKMAERAVAAQA